MVSFKGFKLHSTTDNSYRDRGGGKPHLLRDTMGIEEFGFEHVPFMVVLCPKDFKCSCLTQGKKFMIDKTWETEKESSLTT